MVDLSIKPTFRAQRVKYCNYGYYSCPSPSLTYYKNNIALLSALICSVVHINISGVWLIENNILQLCLYYNIIGASLNEE